MDTSRYQAFLSAAETGSIKNAAEELGYTHPGSAADQSTGGRTGIYTALSKQKRSQPDAGRTSSAADNP